jgi:hypothetical protein
MAVFVKPVAAASPMVALFAGLGPLLVRVKV